MLDRIRFISDITVRPMQQCGGDHMVVAAAKVSTDGEEALALAQAERKAGNYGLINYLISHRHGTPFEHGFITCFVHAPILCFREHFRHRHISVNEESARYKVLEPVFWIPRKTRAMIPTEGYKSARPTFQMGSDDDYDMVVESLKTSYKVAYSAYYGLIQRGIAKEVARACLPVGTYSSCWASFNPRSLMHFLSLRTHESKFDETNKTGAKYVSYPQAEIEEIARQYEGIFKKHWPLTYQAFCENGRVAP